MKRRMSMIPFHILRATIAAAAAVFASVAAAQAQRIDAAVRIDPGQAGPVIERDVYGQFAEHLGRGIYEGVWVGEESPIPNTRGYRNDVVGALRRIKVPVVRWPGGCFADEYHWRDGIGPRGKRPVRINTHWGGVTENNAFGTHEFMDFAELIGAEAYVAGNVGTRHAAGDGANGSNIMTSDLPIDARQRARARTAATSRGRSNTSASATRAGAAAATCGRNIRPTCTSRYQTFVKAPPGSKILKVASGRQRRRLSIGPKC